MRSPAKDERAQNRDTIYNRNAIVADARYLDVKVSDVQLPMGLGSRHLVAASISRVTRAVAVVVSESAQEVRIFEAGVLVGDIIPELWLLSRERIVQSREK